MGTRITHLLIDEFQDTSRDQWFALQPLVEEALAHGGSLTFVGDVKQAIYGWRKGDASLFESIPRLPALCRLTEAPALKRYPSTGVAVNAS
jgi:ATP-dependent exoDNAse (exonuclease V) beta subunit